MTPIRPQLVLGLALAAVFFGFATSSALRAPASPASIAVPPSVDPAGECLPLQHDASCGDGRCSPPEDCNTCPSDCGSCCGDHHCRPPEDCHSCPSDCGAC